MTNIHKSWLVIIDKFDFGLDELYKEDKDIYPPKELIFKVFEMSVYDIKVCILGQDVYHQPNQAMGLAFSVPQSVKIPPSLVNIFKELKNEFPERKYNFTHGDLSKWAKNENIFLLNCALTVKKSKPLSHIKKWEGFTNDIIQYISQNNNKCVFLLLGNYAKEKTKIIKNDSRCVKGIHPSPLSAHNGFFNSGIFKKIEELIGKPIDWQN